MEHLVLQHGRLRLLRCIVPLTGNDAFTLIDSSQKFIKVLSVEGLAGQAVVGDVDEIVFDCRRVFEAPVFRLKITETAIRQVLHPHFYL